MVLHSKLPFKSEKVWIKRSLELLITRLHSKGTLDVLRCLVIVESSLNGSRSGKCTLPSELLFFTFAVCSPKELLATRGPKFHELSGAHGSSDICYPFNKRVFVCESGSENMCVCVCVREREIDRERERETFVWKDRNDGSRERSICVHERAEIKKVWKLPGGWPLGSRRRRKKQQQDQINCLKISPP